MPRVARSAALLAPGDLRSNERRIDRVEVPEVGRSIDGIGDEFEISIAIQVVDEGRGGNRAERRYGEAR